MKKYFFLFVLFYSVHSFGQNDFILTINGIDSSKPIKLKKEALKNAVIAAYSKDKKTIQWNIIEFTIKIPGVQAEKIKGNKIDERIFNKILHSASRGDMITIFDIKTNCIKDKLGPYPDPMFPIVIEIY
nr:GldM family protein [uncultured Flavobacterium sp.]